jgi:hypothetical protein
MEYLVDVDIELGQSVEDELALINEDFGLLLQKLLAIYVSSQVPFFISSGMVAENIMTCLL